MRCDAPSCSEKIIHEIKHGLYRDTNFLDDIVVIGFGKANHDCKLDALLNTHSKRNASLNYQK